MNKKNERQMSQGEIENAFDKMLETFYKRYVPHEGRQVPRSGSARQGATMLNPWQAPARARSLGESQITVCARKGATKAWLERVLGHVQ